ncbi:hypothetical protein NUU61_007724 [Penicillium alfredii]|uniref:Uncharacterized protein n=1 Tax=Penicillium alfredii TaxID=1506179 RepID=A0A9W9JZ98_9EURO|nr:uncharacterized protein NUU61_007724 [Penicillium alfredii]KAJ5086417.1 hypothetical protein NUU61_007724 [Penicillium alfredii]
MHVCFKTPKAFNVIEHSWGSQENFNLATYHVGCGDESSGKRSFFHASKPSVNSEDMCVVIPVTPIDESEALHSGVMSWGTYTDPNERRRSPTKGHVRVANPNTNGTKPMPSGGNMDIVTDPSALKTFFNNSHMDTSNMGQMAPGIDFMSTEDPEIPEKSTNNTGRLSARSRALRTKRTRAEISERSSSELARRDIFKGMLRGLQWLGQLLLVPFGVPFDHTYHHDIYFDQHLDGAAVTNKPPKIFGFGNGFTLAESFAENSKAVDWTLQCAKCGVHVNIDIAGRLAFSIKDGITEGTLTLTNKDALTLDAVLGMSGDVKINKSKEKKKRLNKQEKNLQSYPAGVALYIPGILTLGPQLSFGAAVSVEAEGKFELLLGGSVSVGKGTASVSLKGGRNGATGFEPKFDPVLRFKGAATLTGEIGVPMAIEVGINVLSGKFKKTAGLVNTPSVYVQTGLSIDEQKTQNTPVLCPNGISLKVGAKNRIHLSGFDIWEYELSSIPIFERLITCVTTNGIQSGVQAPGLVKTITTEWGEDVTAGNPHIAKVPDRTPKHNGTQGFRILMDGKSDTILVTGNDGSLYLVGKNQGYDISAPWGTIDKGENPLTLDVFGRILSYLPLKPSFQSLRELHGLSRLLADQHPILADLAVSQPHQIPFAYKSTLIATREVITKDGNVKSVWNENGQYGDEMASQLKEHYNLEIKDCRTIQLVTAKSQ